MLAGIISLSAGLLIAQTKDNLGKEFFLAFGPNQGTNESQNVFALYISSPSPATGYVEVPGIAFRQDFTTTPGQITTVNLPSGRTSIDETIEVKTSESVVPRMAVHIVADTDIVVYGMSHKQYSSDAFMAMPVDVLGTEYRVLSYPRSIIGFASPTPGEFWIVAAHYSDRGNRPYSCRAIYAHE